MDDLFAPTHLVLILIIAMVVFGPGKLPELGAGLGKAIRDFKKSMAGVTDATDELKKSVAIPSVRETVTNLAKTAMAEPAAQAGQAAPTNHVTETNHVVQADPAERPSSPAS